MLIFADLNQWLLQQIETEAASLADIHCVLKKVSPLNILQQPLQTCTDLNEILRTQDDIYFCHRRQIS